jgi:hypothetical protein
MLSIIEKETTDRKIHKGLLVEFGKKSYEFYYNSNYDPKTFFRTTQINMISENKIRVLTIHKSKNKIEWQQNGKNKKYFYDKKNKLLALNKLCIMYVLQ